MKLTNTIRDAFIRAAMDDVPAPVDHKEAIRAIVVEDALQQCPPAVRALWKDPKTQCYVKVSTPCFAGTSIVVPSNLGYSRDFRLTPAGQAKVGALEKEIAASNEGRRALASKLRAVAYSVTTRKALAAALPEFEKYLPPDDAAAIRTLPVVANVVADFVKAGWPKGKSKKPATV